MKLITKEAAIAALRVATDELCGAVDSQAEDIGGWRAVPTILQELGPAVDAANKVIERHSGRNDG